MLVIEIRRILDGYFKEKNIVNDMIDNELLIKYNSNFNMKKKKIKFKTTNKGLKFFEYRYTKSEFGIVDLIDLLNFLSYVSKKILRNYPIIIDFRKTIFSDKLTFVILECILYYYINDMKCSNIMLTLNQKAEIHTQGLNLSPLNALCDTTKSTEQRYDLFNKKYNIDLSKKHFRKIILKESDSFEHPVTSLLMQDIESYLKIQEVSKEYTDTIPSVISELVDNVIEHSDSDCLIDIDITPSTFKKMDSITNEYSNENFYALNVVIVNLSDKLLGENLTHKIKGYKSTDEIPQRYKAVKNACNNLQNIFDDNYNEDDFFVIASFQDKISGRIDSNTTGGKGLTELLKSLQENGNTDSYNCYMYSGNSVLWFKKDYLNYNSDGWIGFNDQNNFFDCKPDSEVFTKIPFYFPGTAYNLNFVVKKSE